MTPAALAIVLILISAMSHALVGAVMKRSADKLVLRLILGAVSATVALPFAVTLPPLPGDVWVVLGLGVSLHIIYQIAQAIAFTRGDMSVVYPVMRGFAPALTAGFAILVLGEKLSPIEWLGLGIAVSALVGFGWPDRKSLFNAKGALIFALFCGLLTTLYTVVDAYGIRLADHKFSFIAWLFVLEGSLGVALFSWIKKDGLMQSIRIDLKGGLLAGLLGLTTYTTALLAFSLAPVAPLAALRETSVVFGAVLAAVWLKESFGRKRIALSVWLVIGLTVMHIAG